MTPEIQDRFLLRWQKYFGAQELPLTCFYTDEEDAAELEGSPRGHRCLICTLGRARRGEPLRFGADSLGCSGANRYLGFSRSLRPNFEYFLSCGIPGEMEGERYKKSPELVRQLLESVPAFEAPKKFIVFKRWDKLGERDEPEVVIFFARPDVLSGLFTLAGFDRADRHGVIAPFAAGCGSIVQYPYLERAAEHPRAVLGMFDVSARPCVSPETLSFAVPMKKFVSMIDDMDESFLITPSWELVRARVGD